jgi:aspartyl-tRNA(Asn)/glutamyl-tRNA(Gln) amidotransferase subunit C
MANPPTIDRALMLQLADLARLHIPQERLPALRDRLERIVAAFSALEDADTSCHPPHPPLPLRLRPDVAGPGLPLSEVFANAPQRAGDSFVVPRVVDP